MYLINKAIELPKYIKAIQKRTLLRMPIYITERCNSKCKTCLQWTKQNPQDMSVDMIKGIVDDFPKAFYVVQGGEPTLHPEIEEILELLRGHEYQLFSNGMLPDKLEMLVKKYGVPYVALSCDGTGEAYQRSRGVDNFDNIPLILGKLKGITNLELSYIISQWNNREELLKIAELAKEYEANFHVDVYDEIKYFSTIAKREEIYKADDVVSYPTSKCLKLYNKWLFGDVRILCHSIKFSCFITTDGGVYACGRKLTPLGNLHTQSLKEIWNSSQTKAIQDGLKHCNDCFATCYRHIDVALASMFPKIVLEQL